ncbi:Uncharacterised protein [Actinobacillus pleuropneumoniae]|nr:Uncharacterised protein [Actinobacillus pleuropneumoniae]
MGATRDQATVAETAENPFLAQEPQTSAETPVWWISPYPASP